AASLDAHRRAAHGVAGAQAAARASRGKRSRRGRATSAQARPAAASTNRSSAETRSDGINRHALLSALFPNGIPPREEVIRSLNEWLDEGERLAKLRLCEFGAKRTMARAGNSRPRQDTPRVTLARADDAEVAADEHGRAAPLAGSR